MRPPHPALFPRYKMTCEYTWPNHLMASDREATQALLEQHGFQDDVAYGHTKVFIRTPRTLFCLEQERAQLIPIIVLLLQKVGARGTGRRGDAGMGGHHDAPVGRRRGGGAGGLGEELSAAWSTGWGGGELQGGEQPFGDLTTGTPVPQPRSRGVGHPPGQDPL